MSVSRAIPNDASQRQCPVGEHVNGFVGSTRPVMGDALAQLALRAGANGKVALWLCYGSTHTTEDYLRVDVMQRIEVLDLVTPIQWCRRASSDRPTS